MLPKLQHTKIKYKIVFLLKYKYSIVMLCNYLNCSRSGYYDWIKRNMPNHNKLDLLKSDAILKIYNQKKSRGRRQIKMQLKRQFGLHMSLGSVHRYMTILNIKSVMKRKPKYSKKEERKSTYTFANVLNRDFLSSTTIKKWVTDITYLQSTDGTEYLSCIKDLSDKSIISYHMSNKNDIDLVMQTLNKALKNVEVDKFHGLILHSDQGHQYTSKEYHDFLSQNGIIGSMSRKGNPYDNAPIESYFSVLKNEELKLHKKRTMNKTREIVDRFIYEYNYERPQFNLKDMTPIEYRCHL